MSRPEASRIVVIGGGITGLTAAYTLVQANLAQTNRAQAPRNQDESAIEIVLLESSDRLGGKILTTPFMGRPVDEGADAFLTRVPWALDLLRSLSGQAEIAAATSQPISQAISQPISQSISQSIPATISPAASNAFVVSTRRRTALRELPQGLVMGVPTSPFALLKSRLVGLKDVARMSLDLIRSDNWQGPDETVGELVSRRLGTEIADAVVGPLLGSINAGDIHQLEALSVAPVLATAAREGGSLIRSLRRLRPDTPSPTSGASSPTSASATGSVFASFNDGMGVLPAALVAAISAQPAQIRTGVAVADISLAAKRPAKKRADHRLVVTTSQDEQIEAAAVVVATPTFVAQRLVGAAAPATAELLKKIEYASVAIATLGFNRSQIKHRLDGAGLLVPAREGMLTTACSFGSTKWPHWANEDRVVLRVSVGRHGDKRAMAMNDQDLVAAVVSELSPLLGISGDLLHQRVSRWEDSLPQYASGHQSLVTQIEHSLAKELPGVMLAGAGYRGLGIPACIRQGHEAANAALAAL